MTCDSRCERLGPGPDPVEVIRRAAGTDGLVGLIGEWAGSGALITARPLAVATQSPGAAMAAQPSVHGDQEVVGGGWFGWVPYRGPARLAFFDNLLRYRDGAWYFEALWSEQRAGVLRASRDAWVRLLDGPDAAPPWQVCGDFSGPDPDEHLAAVERAIQLIRAGEIYQVNICTRLQAAFSGSCAAMFADAVHQLRPRLAAYVDGGGRQIASMSPELFLRRRGREVTTAPIKGTWPSEDRDGAAALRRSAKDVAENVMIVDLMRNDLGRIAQIGSVRVQHLLDVQEHPGVWHLVSSIGADLRADADDAALLSATFPPGSVTGAPKHRAMQVIDELEAHPRNAYTGAVGYASPLRGLELAVAIRTFEVSGGCVELGVGGGITADSVPMREWRECLDKAAPLVGAVGARLVPGLGQATPAAEQALLAGGLLETMLVIDGCALRLPEHLARLDRSSRELFGHGLAADLESQARAAATGARGRSRMRIVLTPDGAFRVTVTPAPAPPVACDVQTVVRRAGLWRHKWANRRELAALERAGTVPLLLAADGTVLETSRGNVFLLCTDGGLVTPPLRDDLLPGVTRRALLDLCRDVRRRTQLRCFDVAELSQHAAFWTSSLSGLVAIRSVNGMSLPDAGAELAELSAGLGLRGAAEVAKSRIVR